MPKTDPNQKSEVVTKQPQKDDAPAEKSGVVTEQTRENVGAASGDYQMRPVIETLLNQPRKKKVVVTEQPRKNDDAAAAPAPGGAGAVAVAPAEDIRMGSLIGAVRKDDLSKLEATKKIKVEELSSDEG